MKHRFLLFICVCLFLPLSSYAVKANGSGVVNATSLNVRSAPSMDAEIITTLSNGARVEVITKTSGTWYKIVSGSQTGYVHSDYLRVSRRSAAPARIVAPPQSFEGYEKGEQLVEYAKQFLGVDYLWGGMSPEGFDCSGFVCYVYEQFDVRLNRIAADQLQNGAEVGLEDIRAGDILLFHNPAYEQINHVGIYVGNGEFIHSPQTGDVVKISTIESGYYFESLVAARRVFD